MKPRGLSNTINTSLSMPEEHTRRKELEALKYIFQQRKAGPDQVPGSVMANQNSVSFINYVINSNDDDVTGGAYDYAILQLRTRLEVDSVSSGGNRRPVLAELVSNINNIKLFDIHFIRNPTTRVTIRIRQDDLYVLGYQVNNQQWREFLRDDGVHLVDPNSRFLTFDGSYTQLAREGGALTSLTLGREALRDAVDKLVASANNGEIARGLAVIIMMFSEAARFAPIQGFVQTVFVPNDYLPITRNIAQWMIDLVHRWGNLSGFILYYIRNPSAQWVPQTLVILGPGPHFDLITVVTRTVGQMLYYMGILQNSPANIHPAPPN